MSIASTGHAGALHTPRPPFAPERTHVSFRRYLAHAVDGVIVMFGVALLAIPAGILSGAAMALELLIGFTLGQLVYYVETQARSGQTIGKRINGLRVVDERGEIPSRAALWKRTIPLLIEYAYIVAWLAMAHSDYRQRLGDRWAHTYVIEV